MSAGVDYSNSSLPAPACLPLPACLLVRALPVAQKEVVRLCRQMGKPVIVASHLLQSMHTLPTPTRAEVSGHSPASVCPFRAACRLCCVHFSIPSNATIPAVFRLPIFSPCCPRPCCCVQVSDVADCVRQRADGLMLCGETAAGAYPLKSLEELRSVAMRIEEWVR